jgi:RNA polymerase subunit RPABC4/transcription elongation factor Spt4
MPHDPDDDADEYDAETDYDPDDPETYPAGVYADDGRAAVPCRHCRAEIDEDAEQCPKCGMYVTDEDATPEKKSAVWTALVVLALAAALLGVLGSRW